jgi:predicted porin
MNNGHNGIRNVGAGDSLGDLCASVLYTYSKNMLTGGAVQVGQISGFYSFNTSWRLGTTYQYMAGNAQLEHNRAQQVTTTLQYSLSKRTMLYAEAAYQWSGDVAGEHDAWIGGRARSSTDRQFVGCLGMQTFF